MFLLKKVQCDDPILRYMAPSLNDRSVREMVIKSLPQMLQDGRMSRGFFEGDLIGTAI